MNAEGVHLSANQKALAVRSELGPSTELDHLEACEICWREVEALRRREQPSGHAPSRSGAPPEWLREVALASYEQLRSRSDRASRTSAVVRRPKPRANVGSNLRWAAAGAATLLCAVVVTLGIRSEHSVKSGAPVRDDSGRVEIRQAPSTASANLFCRDADRKTPLLDAESACPSGARIAVSLNVPEGSWRHVALVVCEAKHCDLAVSRSLGTSGATGIEFQNPGGSGARRGILVFSNTELDVEQVARAVGKVEEVDYRRIQALELDFDAQQIPFDWSVSHAP